MEIDYTALSLEELFKLGDVSVHNVGPDFVVIDFLSGDPGNARGIKYHGEGTFLLAAIANLKSWPYADTPTHK